MYQLDNKLFLNIYTDAFIWFHSVVMTTIDKAVKRINLLIGYLQSTNDDLIEQVNQWLYEERLVLKESEGQQLDQHMSDIVTNIVQFHQEIIVKWANLKYLLKPPTLNKFSQQQYEWIDWFLSSNGSRQIINQTREKTQDLMIQFPQSMGKLKDQQSVGQWLSTYPQRVSDALLVEHLPIWKNM